MNRSAIVRGVRAFLSRNLPRPLVAAWQVREWQQQGRPLPPPPAAKRAEIRRYAKAASIRTFVETGTYQGDTVDALRRSFDRIYSFELNEEYARRAQARFAKYPHISIVQGDSARMLPGVLEAVDEPCLFWLDAHHSGGDTAKGDRDTPIVQELRAILERSKGDTVVLIDDASDFVGKNDYPTLAELRSFLTGERPDWVFDVRDNIIRFHPKLPAAVSATR